MLPERRSAVPDRRCSPPPTRALLLRVLLDPVGRPTLLVRRRLPAPLGGRPLLDVRCRPLDGRPVLLVRCSLVLPPPPLLVVLLLPPLLRSWNKARLGTDCVRVSPPPRDLVMAYRRRFVRKRVRLSKGVAIMQGWKRRVQDFQL